METADVVIGGAGIIGLSAALELRRRGFRVVAIDRGQAMAGASRAAAGMLAAEDPENPAPLAELAALSARLYENYLAAIESLSGHAVPVRTRNTLQASSLNEEFHCETSRTRRSISPEQAASRIPGLEVLGRSLLWLDERSLDPRDLCAALPEAARRAGVVLEENSEITTADLGLESVRVTTARGQFSAVAFLNCCGAWASTIRAEPERKLDKRAQPVTLPSPSVLPRKGQMVMVRMDGPVQLRQVLRMPAVYLVPRGDGRIVIGATVEDAGFNLEVTPETMHALIERAARIWPPIRNAAIVESWAGLRPGTADELPLIGSGGHAGYWLATGHFRNGILLAPATGRVICDLLEGRRPEAPLDAFDPLRGVDRQISTPFAGSAAQ